MFIHYCTFLSTLTPEAISYDNTGILLGHYTCYFNFSNVLRSVSQHYKLQAPHCDTHVLDGCCFATLSLLAGNVASLIG